MSSTFFLETESISHLLRRRVGHNNGDYVTKASLTMGNHRQGDEASRKDVAYHKAIEENRVKSEPFFPVLG